jgi:hypothetical protein
MQDSKNELLLHELEGLFTPACSESPNRKSLATATEERIQKLSISVLMQLEQESTILREGLLQIKWWERLFQVNFPATYERLKKSVARRNHAMAAFDQKDNIWQELFSRLHTTEDADDYDNACVELGQGIQMAIQPADEFGLDILHGVIHIAPSPASSSTIESSEAPFSIKMFSYGNNNPASTNNRLLNNRSATTIELNMEAFQAPNLKATVMMKPLQLWTMPFQEAVLVLLANTETGHQELVSIPTPSNLLTSSSSNRSRQAQTNKVEPSMWALNHNAFAESPENFQVPPYLLGDPTMTTTSTSTSTTEKNLLMVAATEGRTDIANVRTGLVAIGLRKRDFLLFDQLSQSNQASTKETQTTRPAKHWRQLVTSELWEPRRIPISCACMVLDAFLLYASHDGVLRAHPRGNPQSTYHVQDMGTLVHQMMSLYNVVALIHSYDVLEVRLVEKIAHDPFIQLQEPPLYRTNLADLAHPPLLYGPYIIYAALDGKWNRVRYDIPVSLSGDIKDEEPHNTRPLYREPIKVPYKAGWKIVSIKNANWRFWTLVLRNPRTNFLEEYWLIQ